MKDQIFVLTSNPPEQPGGVEHLVRELVKGLEERGYKVKVFHRENCMPTWLRSPSSRLGCQIAGTLVGYFVGRVAQKHIDETVAAVISHGPIGWYPLNQWDRIGVKQIHFYHGTYRGQAEAIRSFISRKGYHVILQFFLCQPTRK